MSGLKRAGIPHHEIPATRRDFLAKAGAGFGSLALTYLLGGKTVFADEAAAAVNPLAPKKGHYAGKAKSVIFCFMEGGPSAIDTFDPKPKLNELAGKPLPNSFGQVI